MKKNNAAPLKKRKQAKKSKQTESTKNDYKTLKKRYDDLLERHIHLKNSLSVTEKLREIENADFTEFVLENEKAIIVGIKKKEPRLNEKEVKPFLDVIALYLSKSKESENNSIKTIFGKYTIQAKADKDYQKFLSGNIENFKSNFRQWCRKKMNQDKYDQIKIYLLEKERRKNKGV